MIVEEGTARLELLSLVQRGLNDLLDLPMLLRLRGSVDDTGIRLRSLIPYEEALHFLLGRPKAGAALWAA